jgi:hypothetical protein
VLKEIRNEYVEKKSASEESKPKQSKRIRSTRQQASKASSPPSSHSSEESSKPTPFSSMLPSLGASRVVIIVRDTRSLTQVRDFLACPAYTQDKAAASTENAKDGARAADGTTRPKEGILHKSIRQFVTQQATLIRQTPTGAGSARAGWKGKGNGSSSSSSSSSAPSITHHGVVDIESEIEVATTGRPMTEKAFNSLRIDQKMMLVLEKNLQNNSVPVRVLGLDLPPSSSGVDASSTATMAPKKRPTAEPSGPTKKRLRTAKEGVTSGDKPQDEDADSIADSTAGSDTEPVVSVLDDMLHVYVLTHDMCHSSYNHFEDIRPSRVIFLDADVKTIRLVETFQANSLSEMKVTNLCFAQIIINIRSNILPYWWC